MKKTISNFALAEYEFLVNAYPTRLEKSFEFEGLKYRNFETAYQAAKLEKESDRSMVSHMRPDEAKHFVSKSGKLRKDWEKPLKKSSPSPLCTSLKDEVMYRLLLIKFTQYPDFRDQLVATGDAEIIKINQSGDCYWGVCNGVGQSKIGKMLMEIRSLL